MSETFFNPDLKVKPGGDEVRTMGGLEALPAEDTGGDIDLGQFIGSAAQLAQLYPGTQNRPQYEPGLTDIRFTRSFTGMGPSGSSYTPSGASMAPGPSPTEIVYQQPLPQPQAEAGALEPLLGKLLGMDWSGAYQDYLNKLEAQQQDINISNVFTPTNTFTPTVDTDIEFNPVLTNIQQQSQEQAQYMGDSTGQRQDQDQDDSKDFDIDSYLRDILSKTGGTSGGGLDDFFNKGPVTPGGTSPIDFIKGQVEADRIAKAAAEEAAKAAQEAERKRIADEAIERTRQQEEARKAEEARQRELATQEAERQRLEAVKQAETERQAQEAARIAEEARKADEARKAEEARIAEEARVAEEARQRQLAEEAERQRQLAAEEAARKAEEARVADEARKAEEARQAAEAEAQRQAAAQQAEEARLAEEARQRQLTEEAERQRQLAAEEARKVAEAAEAKRQAEEARKAEVARIAAEKAEAKRLAEEARQRRIAERAEAQRQAAAAKAERARKAAEAAEAKRQAELKAAPIVDQATAKFQSDIANAVKQRDDLKRNYDDARAKYLYAMNTPGDQGYPPAEVRLQLKEGYQNLDKALKGYDLNRIANDPVYARQQALKSGSKALKIFSDPEKPPPPKAVDRALEKVVDSGLVDVAAKALTEEAAKRIIESAGGDAAAAAAGDIAGPAAAAIITLARGGSAGTAIAEGAKAYAVATLAAIPGVGQALAAAIVLDSVLSGALGYESPVNEAVAGAAKNIDKAFSWVGRSVGSDPLGGIVDWGSRAIGRDPIGSVGNFVSNVGRSIGRALGFQEGGLVDLGEDSMYNEYDDYGGLFGLPFEVVPDMPTDQPMMYARGGIIPLPGGGKIARGPGGGLDDLIPTSIDGRRAAALSDGEFVIPADVVSMMGDGSSNAGAKRLYDLVRQIRQDKTGTSRQAGPLQVGKILERTMR